MFGFVRNGFWRDFKILKIYIVYRDMASKDRDIILR